MNELILGSAAGTRLFHRWFVQYNPLYFASAFLVLAGVYLLTRYPADWDNGQLGLSGVIQLYELALIAGAALLFDLPGQRRPAVILGIAAIAFLFDVTFRTEGLASVGTHTLPAALAWTLLFGLKLALLGRALRVELPAAHCAAWMLAALFVAGAPHLLAAGAAPKVTLVAACWLGIALVTLALYGAQRVRTRVPLDAWGQVVLDRLVRLTPALWSLLYWTHVLTWCGIHDLDFTPLCFAPLVFVLPMAMWRERAAWIAIALALGVAAQWPGEFAAVALLLALGAVIKAYSAGWPRLYLAAALLAYAAALAWSLGGVRLGPPPPWLALAGFLVLSLLAWRFRLPTGVVAGVLCGSPALIPVLPVTAAHWGALSLASAFVALAGGLGLNWWSSRPA